MTLKHHLKNTAYRILDYLKGFTPREDTYALDDSKAGYHRNDRNQATDTADRFVRSNHEAFNDLDIGCVLDQVFAAVSRQYEKGKVCDREYVDDIFHNPVNDRGEIAQRQEVISELQSDKELWNQVLAVKSSLDVCLYDERFRSAVNGLKSLQDASNIVEFVLSIRKMREPLCKRLKSVKDLGARFDGDERFREAEKFMKELYLPYGIGDAIEDNMDYLNSISAVGSRREFYGGNRIILEATEKMLSDESFVKFINDEARALHLLTTMKSKLDIWHKEIFSFNLSGINLETWGRTNAKSMEN